jgi:hypothetical protein
MFKNKTGALLRYRYEGNISVRSCHQDDVVIGYITNVDVSLCVQDGVGWLKVVSKFGVGRISKLNIIDVAD